MPAVTLKMTDETAGGTVLHEVEVSFSNALTTVQEIIRSRVYAEVQNYNERMPEYFKGLVQPGEAEATLNGFRLKERRKVDAERQYGAAIEAFKKNGYFILIDHIQAESLEQMVVVNPGTQISFIKLTPLVGG